jgi:hypothetical protein
MKKALLTLVMLLCAASVAMAEEAEKATTKDGKPYFEASEKVTAQATVLAVGKSNRAIKMRTEKGDTVTVTAGPEVKNYGQIKKGDIVKITYTEKLTVHVEAEGAPEVSEEATSAAAKPGEMPKASFTNKTTYKATILSINKEAGTVTLKGMDGAEYEITPRHPENMDLVKVGELVVFTYTESIAASVERVKAKK